MNFAVVIQKNRKGRKRKSTKTISAVVPRYSNGKCVDEAPAQIRATGLIQRLKLGVPLKDAFDERWGYTLGQMRLRGKAFEDNPHGQRDPSGIDETQFQTAQRYEELIFRHRHIKGLPNLFPKSPAFSNWIQGQSLAPELPQDKIDELLGKFRNARSTLLKTGDEHGVGARVNWIVYEIVIMDRSIDLILPNDFGNFKLGLNALARVV